MRPWVNAAIWLAVYVAFVSFVAWGSSPADWKINSRLIVSMWGVVAIGLGYLTAPMKKS